MKKNIAIFGLALSVSIISCEKSADFNVPQDNLNVKSGQILIDEISVDNAVADINSESDFYIGAESMMMGMHNNGMQLGWNNSRQYRMGQHPVFRMHGQKGQYPNSLVMNYGMGTQLNNGRMMSGSMIIHISEANDSSGFIREMTYENFSIDSMMINGTTTMTFFGDRHNGGNHEVVDDITITMPDGKIIHRESKIVREWISGVESDLNQMDDTMQITGYVLNRVTEPDGTVSMYRKDITVPLVKTSGCRYFSQGIIAITQEGTVIAILNYGEGECDDVALLTNSGGTSKIVLSDNDHCGNGKGNGMGNGQGNGMGQGNNGTSNGTGMGNNNNGSGQGNGMGMGKGRGKG